MAYQPHVERLLATLEPDQRAAQIRYIRVGRLLYVAIPVLLAVVAWQKWETIARFFAG